MENRPIRKITVEMIVNQQFNSEHDGYNRAEVDAFLNDICDFMEEEEKRKAAAPPVMPAFSVEPQIDPAEIAKKDAEIARLQGLVKQAQRETAEAKAKLEIAPKSEIQISSEQATNLLLNAQKVYDKTISDANERAEEIKKNAQEESDKQIASLSHKRDELLAEVDTLKRSFEAYLGRLSEMLDSQQSQLSAAYDKLK